MNRGQPDKMCVCVWYHEPVNLNSITHNLLQSTTQHAGLTHEEKAAEVKLDST